MLLADMKTLSSESTIDILKHLKLIDLKNGYNDSYSKKDLKVLKSSKNIQFSLNFETFSFNQKSR